MTEVGNVKIGEVEHTIVRGVDNSVCVTPMKAEEPAAEAPVPGGAKKQQKQQKQKSAKKQQKQKSAKKQQQRKSAKRQQQQQQRKSAKKQQQQKQKK
jgi:hypothetical protein